MENSKKCIDCMYYKNGNCIRKKEEVAVEDFCLHFVDGLHRRSVEEIIKIILSPYIDERE